MITLIETTEQLEKEREMKEGIIVLVDHELIINYIAIQQLLKEKEGINSSIDTVIIY